MGNTIYLTRWAAQNNIKLTSVYISTRTGDKWSEPMKKPLIPSLDRRVVLRGLDFYMSEDDIGNTLQPGHAV